MPMRMTTLLAITAALFLGGCMATPSQRAAGDYQTIPTSPRTRKAQEANARAARLIEQGQYEQAQKLLEQALGEDVMYGPAHNNLGKVYYHQDKLYQAAWEFQYAIKLMPHHPEPKNNLGLVFEQAGKLDQAVEQYAQAKQVEPDHPQIIGNLARARIKRGDKGSEVRELLEEIVLKDDREPWVKWAREQLALLPEPQERIGQDLREPGL